jgi:curved DNA-binding protein CbpA
MAPLERTTDENQAPFATEGLAQYSQDHYAVLGVPIDADLDEVRKNYRNKTKLLHPDRFFHDPSKRKSAEFLLSRVVNPAFETLSNADRRRDYDLLLRLASIKFRDNQTPLPDAPEVLRLSPARNMEELKILYRKEVEQLTKDQYTDLNDNHLTNVLSVVNLGFLILSIPLEKFSSPKAVSSQVTGSEVNNVPAPPAASGETAKDASNWSQRHFERGKELVEKRQFKEAIRSFKEAIRLAPSESSYYSHLGLAYLSQGFPGMAKAEFQRALQLNPKDEIACTQLGIGQPAAKPQSAQKAKGNVGPPPQKSPPKQKSPSKKWWPF